MPTYSICIPVKDRIDFFILTLESVLNQTYTNFEIVISDNSSTGNDIVKNYIDTITDKRIKYYRQPMFLSMVENWNFLISVATGKYISILHDDDLLNLDAVKKVHSILTTNKSIGFVFCKTKLISEDGTKSNIAFPTLRNSGLLTKEYYKRLILKSYFFKVPGVFFKKSLVEEYGAFSKWLPTHSDYEFFIRIGINTTVYYESSVLGYYRRHKNNLTKSALIDFTSMNELLNWQLNLYKYRSFLEDSDLKLFSNTLWKYIILFLSKANHRLSFDKNKELFQPIKKKIDIPFIIKFSISSRINFYLLLIFLKMRFLIYNLSKFYRLISTFSINMLIKEIK